MLILYNMLFDASVETKVADGNYLYLRGLGIVRLRAEEMRGARCPRICMRAIDLNK